MFQSFKEKKFTKSFMIDNFPLTFVVKKLVKIVKKFAKKKF